MVTDNIRRYLANALQHSYGTFPITMRGARALIRDGLAVEVEPGQCQLTPHGCFEATRVHCPLTASRVNLLRRFDILHSPSPIHVLTYPLIRAGYYAVGDDGHARITPAGLELRKKLAST
jgi:hypothetical protein